MLRYAPKIIVRLKDSEMGQIKETTVNRLTKKHLARILVKFEEDLNIPFWMKQELKKEFWMFNQNLKEQLFKEDCIDLNEVEKPWIPPEELKKD